LNTDDKTIDKPVTDNTEQLFTLHVTKASINKFHNKPNGLGTAKTLPNAGCTVLMYWKTMLFYYSNGKWNKEDYEHFQYDVIQMILHKVVAKKNDFCIFWLSDMDFGPV